MTFIDKMKQNYEKFQLRGAIKEIMRNYGLRTISLKNYYDYLNSLNQTNHLNHCLNNVHSVKFDIMNGYINVYKFKENDDKRRCGEQFTTVSNKMYKEIYDVLESLIKNDYNIPYNKKKNIMVKINR